MKGVEAIERYLGAQVLIKGDREQPVEPRVRPFITISRQAGAGGHRLAEALIETFAAQDDVELFGGWQVFDRKLCEIVAANPVYSNSMESLLAEEYQPRTQDFFQQILSSTVDQDVLAKEVFRVVGAVASIGKSIVVGRAGSEVTRELDTGISVRIVAPEEDRIKGVMAFYSLDERAAREQARRLDTSRARLLKSHFQVDIDDPTRYDATWNTGQTPVPVIAECVAVMLRRRVEARLPVPTK